MRASAPRFMHRLRRPVLPLLFCGGLLLSALPGRAATTPVAFTLEIYGNGNTPTIRLVNESRIAISRFELTIGNYDYSWDYAAGFWGNYGGSVSVSSPDAVNDGAWADTIDLRFNNGMPPGGYVYFEGDVDDNSSGNGGLNFRTVLFNNGQDKPNATAKVTLVNGQSAMITLPDGAADLYSYTYQSEARRRDLWVESVAELAGGDDFVNRAAVLIDGTPATVVGTGVPAENIGRRVRIYVYDGERVQVSAPREVYKDIHGDDITDSVLNDPDKIQQQAVERFTAIGMSLNNVAQSGDPTFLNFDVKEDSLVVVKWQHEFALEVEHDFSRTESTERDEAGNPWAGPLTSDAEGNPAPQAKKNWIKRGDTVVAQIDGQVLDFNRAGLDVRYVPIGYVAGGPPNGATTPSDDGLTRNSLFLAAQVLEVAALRAQLVAPVKPAAVTEVWNRFTPAGRTTLNDAAASDLWADTLAGELNGLVQGSSLWDSGSFADVVRRPETQALLDQPLTAVTLPRANRLLLEDTFPSALQRTRLAEQLFPFGVRQSQPQRQQVPQFTMYGPGVIRYVWQIQYGVRVNVDDPQRAALPRVYRGDKGQWVQVGSGEGTFWFDPGTAVRVVTAANDQPTGGSALRGWYNGDGHYFSVQGEIDSESGALISGGPATGSGGGPVGVWTPEYLDPTTSQAFRGLDIPQLLRSARVFWRYDRQAMTIQAVIGEFVFQRYPGLEAQFSTPPVSIEQRNVTGANRDVGSAQMAVWDPVASRLYPLVPGRFAAKWRRDPALPDTMDVTVDVRYPDRPHYSHVAGTPAVALDPDPADAFAFQEIRYTETDAAVDSQKRFTATQPGYTVLLFSELQKDGRGVPRQFLRVRVVETKTWESVLSQGTAIIGRKVPDLGYDRAGLGTGFIYDPHGRARYNPFIYDVTKLDGLAARDVYDLAALQSDAADKIILHREKLPGPIIPVNLHPGAAKDEKLIVIWYDDPAENDQLLWPYHAVVYDPRWPETAEEGLGQIVIASQFGSEGLDASGAEQVVVGPQGDLPAETTYNPSRLQQVQVYSQPDRALPGYNPNEEHGLTAPSLRFADVSPRPPAIYALRNNDLNDYQPSLLEGDQDPATYTSHPRVLVQFLDTATGEFAMRVYEVAAENAQYRFAEQGLVIPATPGGTVNTSASRLNDEPSVAMEAGEPVIPFYPLGVVIGASPCARTTGANIKGQLTYWEDHRGSSWSVSGGSNAWFTVAFHYPLAPDFWWPEGRPGYLRQSIEGNAVVRRATVPATGDCVPFVPADLFPLLAKQPDDVVDSTSDVARAAEPVRVLYKSDWPQNTPVLKAGETLTFAGGEYRADRPFRTVDGELVETEGLPGVVAFASAEVVFDSRNPSGSLEGWRDQWTARVAQVLDVRSTPLSLADFPPVLQPATKRSRVKGGKYVFDELPSSLQRRFRYDPLGGRLELIGLLNDKNIGDSTLTASPPAVYILEPNILTAGERDALKKLDGEDPGSLWDKAVEDLYKLSRNPSLVDTDSEFFLAPPTSEATRGAWQTRLEQFWRHYYFGVLPADAAVADTLAELPTVSGLRATDPVPTPVPIDDADPGYLVGLEPRRVFDLDGDAVQVTEVEPPGDPEQPPQEFPRAVLDPRQAVPLRAFGPGLAVVPNDNFLAPTTGPRFPEYVAVVENNDPSLGGSPITVHIVQVDPNERYRGAIKTVESDNVFDENVVLRHTGDFGAHADELKFEWWYRFDDGSLNVPPPDRLAPGAPNPWKLFPDPTGNGGLGRYQITLAGNPNVPEALLADSFWFVRYRHVNDVVEGTNWKKRQADGSPQVKYDWAGAGNSDPLNGDYRAQLAQGWIKRVLDAVNPYEARIRDFEGDHPSTVASMIAQFGQPYVGPVALNPSQNVIENVGLIELYETILKRGRDLSIDLTRPVSTPAIANALQLASTRISDFYTILGNEAYVDALDPTIGFGSEAGNDLSGANPGYGSLAPAVFCFQNQVSSLIEEELALLRGVDDFFARPVYNRLFWNFTKGEGEAAYAMNYNLSDVNADGFINEDDAMLMYPQGHGDAWGHYLTALRNQYDLLRDPNFNWVSRSEFYNLQDIVLKVDFLDERKFAQTAAARAKTGAEIVNLTYRSRYVEDPNAQWQGYTDSDADRAWGVQGWARRAGQGAYFDWVVANALLPAHHPNTTLEGIQKVDRTTNPDIPVISANLNAIQSTFDQANKGYNPLGIARDALVFDIDPTFLEVGSTAQIGTRAVQGLMHFDQIFERALKMMENAVSVWNNANDSRNMLRQVGNSEAEQRNAVFQEDLTYRNELIRIFGKPYEGTIGPGKVYPAGYDGPDLLLYMYVDVREINNDTVPGPTADFAKFDGNALIAPSQIYEAVVNGQGKGGAPRASLSDIAKPGVAGLELYLNPDVLALFAPSFYPDSTGKVSARARDGLYAVNYTDLTSPKVGLDKLTQLMPVTAAGYTFQAPREWGARGAVGELQLLINQMLQQEAQIASAIGAWDSLQGGIVREIRFINAKLDMTANVRLKNEIFTRLKYITTDIVKGIKTTIDTLEAAKDVSTAFWDTSRMSLPSVAPTVGLAVSPGDILAPVKGALNLAGFGVTSGITVGQKIAAFAELIAEIGLDVAENELNLFEARESDALDVKEMLKELENLVGDEPIRRIEIFKEIQALRELSDQYRTLADQGTRLIDERAAFNKRVSAATQRNRYQDMTFRVSRNQALQSYRAMFDLTARYAYLAAKAYDYETNFDPDDPGSPRDILQEIVRARTLGKLDGEPRVGSGGLAEALAKLRQNYEVLKGQLGIKVPQIEIGKISLRTENYRIAPRPEPEAPGAGATPTAADLAAAEAADALWREVLEKGLVEDLWTVPEFRYYCRPFNAETDASGQHIPEPGIVLRFSTTIQPGKNFFGHPLSGGDHIYDPSSYATKIQSVGVWLSDYPGAEVSTDLPATPRVYLLPVGADIMSVATSADPGVVRVWKVLDQRIPVPLPATTAQLDSSAWIPLLDSLNGRLGEARKYSMFRAFHDGGASADEAINDLELVADTRLVARSIWNTQWLLIIPGRMLNADPAEGLRRLIENVSDLKLVFRTYGVSGG